MKDSIKTLSTDTPFFETTDDTILNGRISLKQPKNGYRVAIDPIILAAFVQPKDNQSILDVGCGVGTISFILKSQNPSLKITAIDIDEKMCELCRYNSIKNGLNIDIQNIAIETMRNNESFDHIVTNPPFFPTKSHRISDKKLLANFETIELEKWISCCLKLLKNKGTFSMIHTSSRLDEILFAVRNKLGNIIITPIFAKPNDKAIRIVVQGIKGSHSEVKINPAFIIHSSEEKFSKQMQHILKGKVI
ncbi:MAG: methyltransferase [Alphaproteobacteria bacterium]|nr:methyltransferase [Alphaproteobacteria bacterium]MBR2137006.1 methyltransferase [Alphaproteobacteria bacterium]